MKVLIGIDDSTCSDLALQSVCKEQWSVGTQFFLLMVVEPLSFNYAMSEAYYLGAMDQARKEYFNYCQNVIDKNVKVLQSKFADHQVTGQVLEGDIASSIIEEAEKQDIDLIVVGSHGRRGFQKFLLGSVAEKVTNHAPCSVQIIRQKLGKKKNIENETNAMAVV